MSKLLESKFHEERLLSILMLVNLFKSGDEDDQELIYELYLDKTKFINNWDIVDISAGNIVGAFLFDEDKAPLYRLVFLITCGSGELPLSPLFILSEMMNLMTL